MAERRLLFEALGSAVRALRGRLDRALSPLGLRLAQYQVLRLLWDEDGLTPRELAERLTVEMPTVTRTLQRMQRDGLVGRGAHPADARSVRIWLTDRGRQLEGEVRELLVHETEVALSDFSPEERDALGGMLARITANARP